MRAHSIFVATPLLLFCMLPAHAGPVTALHTPAAQASAAAGAQVLLTNEQLATMLPPSVYYRGKSAPIQLRNSAGIRFGADANVLATMVDSSGYASSVQETYQLYFLTETALSIGAGRLSPGAYGAGLVNGKFTITDLGGHVILQESMTSDPAMRRPRPLQMRDATANSVRLYLGRNWIAISLIPSH